MGRPPGSKNKATPAKVPKAKKVPAANRKVTKAHNAAAVNDERLGDEEAARIDCFNAYRDKLKPIEARLKAVQKQLDDVYGDAKADKFPKKLFKLAQELSGTRKQEEKIISGVKAVRFVAKALGLPIASQLDFFADMADDAGSTRPSPESEGRAQYASGKAAKPPYPPGTADHDEFMKGFYAAQEDAARGGIKPLEPKTKRGKVNGHEAAPAADDDEDTGETPWPEDEDADPARPLN